MLRSLATGGAVERSSHSDRPGSAYLGRMHDDPTHVFFHGTSREFADAIARTLVLERGNVARLAWQAKKWAESYGRPEVTVLTLCLRLGDLVESNPNIGSGDNFLVKPGSRILSAEILAPDDPRLTIPESEKGRGLEIPKDVQDRALAALQAAFDSDERGVGRDD
jgi:hypothetical protein